VTLEVENAAGKHFVGSAFLALGEGLAVTAWHVVHDARRVEARFSDNQRVRVTGLVDKNESLDLALVKLDSGARPRINLSCPTPHIGSRIYLVGSPRGFDFSLSDGLISQVRTVDGVRYYQVSCPISPGDSGGPVLNDRGQAIAVMSWRKADAENVSFAIPCLAVARLNATLAPVAWPEIVPPSHPAGAEPNSAPLVRAAVGAGTSFRDFQKLLADRAGKRLTVIVQEGGKESVFNFEVPRKRGEEPPP